MKHKSFVFVKCLSVHTKTPPHDSLSSDTRTEDVVSVLKEVASIWVCISGVPLQLQPPCPTSGRPNHGWIHWIKLQESHFLTYSNDFSLPASIDYLPQEAFGFPVLCKPQFQTSPMLSQNQPERSKVSSKTTRQVRPLFRMVFAAPGS